MKKLILLCACLLALGVRPTLVVAAPPEVVVVRVYENASFLRFVVSRNGVQAESFEAKTGVTAGQLTAAADLYRQVVTKLYNEGFIMQGTQNAHDGYSTMIFVKP